MKQSEMLIPTLRELPADAEIKSHQLLLRAGFIRQLASGLYTFLPLGKRVLQKVETIVREEMDRIGANEMLMTAMQPSELWKETGRWNNFGPELMRLHDRHEREFALGATHEEVITSIIRDTITSYKKLPLTVYQIQTKFRDEKRPRFGLLRGREFIMKDAYSFHSSKESLDEVYEKMVSAYSNIFRRCGLNFRKVLADSGAMGGTDTHEFMVLSDVGEDIIAYSDESDFAANIEMAPVTVAYEKEDKPLLPLEKVNTGDNTTIDEIANHLNVRKEATIKSLLFRVDDSYVLVLCRGDHEINDIKVKNVCNATQVELATPEEVKEQMNCEIGTIGPIGAPDSIPVIADHAVSAIVNGVCGANESQRHYINVNVDRDFSVKSFADLRFIQEGDPSPDGKGKIKFAKGIEVGHVFKLGTFYSEKMGAEYLDENGRSNPMIMGCYGIGVSRTVAAIVEQYHDDNGMIWPKSVAPFDIHLIPINMKNKVQQELADELYNKLEASGYSVLYDDRTERPGVKFADSDLFGLPLRITVGKRAEEKIVEVKLRHNGDIIEVHVDQLEQTISDLMKELS